MNGEQRYNISDHDLLVRLDQKVNDLKNSLQELASGTFQKIAILEKDKADRADLDLLQKKVNDDVEVRLRKVEDKTAKYLITMTLYSVAVGTMIALIIYHILQT
jgi:hypothetical protein